MRKYYSIIKGMTALSLLVGIVGCQQLEERIDEVSSRVDDIEKSQGEITQDGEVQSIVFIPEYSDGNVRVYYNTKEDGLFTPETMILRFTVAPAELADILAASYKSSLNLEATYTRTKAVSVGDAVSLPILEASALDGKLTVTSSAEVLDQAFFRKELAASVRLSVSLGGICKLSEYVPMAPFVNMGQGDKINIPDINFKAYLVDNFDVNGDGEISVDEAIAVKAINIASLSICSLSGIEQFTGLESLDCSSNNIEVLDLSSNAALRYLNCSNNSLTELDLSEKMYLTDVDCSNNKITKLALSNACALRKLNCSFNEMREIDLHDSHFLSKLVCLGSPINKYNLDNCAELCELFIVSTMDEWNSIDGACIKFIGKYNNCLYGPLNFSIRNTPFTSFSYRGLYTTSLTLDGDFTSVDISQNSLMKSFDFSGHESLSEFRCTGNTTLASLNLDGCTGLTDLHCENNALLSTISLNNCTAIESLVAANCALSSIDVSNYPSLVRLNVGSNSLQKIDVSNNPMLEDLNISGNALSSINVRNNIALKILNISGNRDISFIDLGNNPVLEDLNVSGLSIAELDLTSTNQLKKLDVTDNPNLTKVICPSQEWLDVVMALNDWSDVGPYEDSDGKHIYAGTVIDGVYWAWCNAGYTTNNLYGNQYDFISAQKACPDGWRTPTTKELMSLSKNGSSKTTFNGMEGRWFSGSNSYSPSVPAIFLPYDKKWHRGAYWTFMEGYLSYGFYFYDSEVDCNDYALSSYYYFVRCLKE